MRNTRVFFFPPFQTAPATDLTPALLLLLRWFGNPSPISSGIALVWDSDLHTSEKKNAGITFWPCSLAGDVDGEDRRDCAGFALVCNTEKIPGVPLNQIFRRFSEIAVSATPIKNTASAAALVLLQSEIGACNHEIPLFFLLLRSLTKLSNVASSRISPTSASTTSDLALIGGKKPSTIARCGKSSAVAPESTLNLY
ncbi:hypothetical protein U1Q18_008272 [Sarracenia purpurea var. burkii]